jgi:phage tail sheath protein FI
MAYALSPGVTVIEKDFTSIVPAVFSSTGAFAGVFQWGPILYPVLVSTENDLVKQFGKPSATNFESFFTAANFLSYTSGLYISRSDSTAGKNAVGNASPLVAGTAVKVTNLDSYNTTFKGGTNNFDWAAKYVGTLGNSLKVSFADSATYQNKVLTGTAYAVPLNGTALTATGSAFLTELHIGAILKNSTGGVVGTVTAIASDTSANITAAAVALTAATGCKADWAYASQFDSAPGTSTYASSQNATNDELHVIVIDEDGAFTGTAGTILEKFAFVSKALDARRFDGANNFYRDVINAQSNYIWWMRHTSNVAATGSAWGLVAAGLTFKSLVGGMQTSLAGAVDDYTDTIGAFAQAAWLLYLDDSQYDISLLPVGKATAVTANYVIQNICEVRKDCVAFVSPQAADGTIITGSGSAATDVAVTYRTAITSSSYGFMDTGYKYQYDRYNDAYRWVPLSGDMAGLAARTDYTNDAWWSPAGFTRGQIKNIVKLAINPTKVDRDTLYKQGINPVVAFPGQGVILYGDKTLQAKPSAFDRINVRRLFIVLEKAISKASKYQLFEFNDSFTRAQFVNIVEPFLRDVKGRRGVTDYKVVCDTSNNTPFVIDSNNFVGDIYIKPTRSINFITLNFIATATGVDFTVVGG